MKWYKNPVQMLFGNTVGLLLLLAYTSFLNYASVLTLVGIFVTSLLWAGIARQRQFVQGMVPALVTTSLLQFGYFYSGKDFIPSSVGVPLFLLNLIIVLVVSFAGSWIGKFVGNKIRGKKEEELHEAERRRSQFADSIRRLTAIVLIFYINAFVLVPFVSRVYAKEKMTTDEFIQNYDPDKKYETHPEWVYEPPKERMPKDNPVIGSGSTTQYQSLTEEQIKEIENKCQISGCNVHEELEKTNNQQKTNLEEEAKIQKLELTNPEQAKMERLKKQNLTMDQILKLQKEGKINSKEAFALVTDGVLKGKISAWEAFWKGRAAIQEFVKKNPEAQKIIADFLKNPKDLKNQYRLLSLADKYIGGPFHGAKEAVDAVKEPVQGVISFAKQHPLQALGMAVAGVGIALIAPEALLVVGGLFILGTGAVMTYSYFHGGWAEVATHVFSQKTRDMFAAKDYWGAYSRGTVELAGLVLSLIPESPSKYLEAYTGIKALVTFKKEITLLSDLRLGLALLKQSGKVSTEGVKVAGEMLKLGLKNGDEATKLLGSYLFNSDNLALLGNITKDVKTAEEVGGLEARQAALKKEFDELLVMVKGGDSIGTTAARGAHYVKQNELPRKAETSVAKGTLVDPSYGGKTTYTPKQLRSLEEANQYDQSGAHVFEKHVGKSDQELQTRALMNRRPEEASTYYNEAKYTEVVNGSLSDLGNQTKISDWLKNGLNKNNLEIEYESAEKLGVIYNRNLDTAGKNPFVDSKKAILVLKKRPDSKGYYILTSYPVTKFRP